MRFGAGVGLIVAAGVLWSLQGLLIRQIDSAGPWAILFWRSLGMIPVLAAFLAWRAGGSPLPAIRRVGLAGALGGLGLVAAFGGAIVALQSTTVANAVFLFAASPILAALLGFLALRERVPPATGAAIAVAMAGIFVMVREGLAGGAAVGNAAALLSALGFAAFTVTLRWGRLHDTLPTVLLGAAFAVIAGALAAALAGQPLIVPLADILWSLGMGAVTLSAGMVLYTLGSRTVPAAQATLLSLTEVLLAPLWVWLLLDEGASAATFAGGAILLGAVAFNALAATRRRPARA
jgi:DME family drug/metabolite transporter